MLTLINNPVADLLGTWGSAVVKLTSQLKNVYHMLMSFDISLITSSEKQVFPSALITASLDKNRMIS